MNKKYDAFISHSSNDKRYFVRPLAKNLKEYGAKIWFDEFSLRAGMSLSRSIEKGLSNSRFAIVVLSKSFFEKKWTEFELKALNSIEIEYPGIILPIWYKVNELDVRKFSPYLSDKLAFIYSNKISIEEITIQILEVIREDIFENIHKKRTWEKLLINSHIKSYSIDEYKNFKQGPIRHKEFPIEWIIRIRLIRSMLIEVHPQSMRSWLDGFQRDLHPEDEIHIWEKIATIYKESIDILKVTDLSKKKEVLQVVLAKLSGWEINDVNLREISSNELRIINKIAAYPIPIFDLKNGKSQD